MVADARANHSRKTPKRRILRGCLAGDACGEEDCEAVLTGSTKVVSAMGNSPTSCNVMFSFRRIEKIICSWRNSGTRNAAAYSRPLLLRRVNRSSPLGLAHFFMLSTTSSTSAVGAMSPIIRLGGQVKPYSLSSIVLKAYHPVAPLQVGFPRFAPEGK
jgi:hypothetical protein